MDKTVTARPDYHGDFVVDMDALMEERMSNPNVREQLENLAAGLNPSTPRYRPDADFDTLRELLSKIGNSALPASVIIEHVARVVLTSQNNRQVVHQAQQIVGGR